MTAVTPEPVAPPQMDPALAQFLSGSGLDPGALFAAPGQSTQSQADLSAALLDAARAATDPYQGALPWWAQGLRQSLIAEPQFKTVYQADEGLVYLGQGGETTTTTPVNKFASDMGGDSTATTQPGSDYALTVTQALNLPYTWDEEEVADAMQRLRGAGLSVDSFDMGSNSLVSVWGALVNRAAMTFALSDGKRKVTPWDVLDLYKSEAMASGTYVDPNRTETRVSRNVTEISEGEAWAQLQNNLSQMLGRDPNDQELRDFTYRMGQLAARNPSVSKTITQYKNGEAVSQSTHTDPGFTAADMAESAYESAQNDPDYAEYRSATTYFNAALSALGPIGG